MRRVLSMVVTVLVVAPVGAQGTLVARFSESQFREPTFVVSQAAYVGIFEVLDGGRVAQRFPRVEAQGRFALPAGETALSFLDVNIGRVTETPGTRTVFWTGGGYGNRPVAAGAASTARTLILVASTSPLRMGPSAEFPELFQKSLARADSTLSRDKRTVAAVVAAVQPEGEAQVTTEITTLWVTDYREFRGAGVSIAANDPLPYLHGGATCGGYGIGVLTTYSAELACGREPIWMGGGWSYGFGAGFVPFLPTYYLPGTHNRAPTAPNAPPPVGVFPGQRLPSPGPQGGGVTRVADGPIEQVPALRRVYWSGGIAGAPALPASGGGSADPVGGGGGGGAGRPAGFVRGEAPMLPSPISHAPASAGPPSHPAPVNAPVLVGVVRPPVGPAHPVAAAPPPGHLVAKPAASAPVKKQ